MKIDRIELEGYKSIRKLDLELKSLNVLIGANGAGKSNFISLFELLNELSMDRLQEYIVQSGGADTFLYFGQKTTNEIRIKLQFGQNGYKCVLSPTVDDRLMIKEETCYFHGEGHPHPYEACLEPNQMESTLPKEAEKNPKKVAGHVFKAFQNWRLYHFHDTGASASVKKPGGINDNLYFRPDASNLAAFLFRLKEESEVEYKLIRDSVRMVAPFFDDFLLRPFGKNQDKIRLEWREKGSDYPFLAHHFSDGTLRFICLATLLLQPELPSTVLIDEPELGLHPFAIAVLVDFLYIGAQKAQIIVSTQSVPLVNHLKPEDVLVVDRVEKQSAFRRPSQKEMLSWLDDYGLGDLWEKNVLGGRP